MSAAARLWWLADGAPPRREGGSSMTGPHATQPATADEALLARLVRRAEARGFPATVGFEGGDLVLTVWERNDGTSEGVYRSEVRFVAGVAEAAAEVAKLPRLRKRAGAANARRAA